MTVSTPSLPYVHSPLAVELPERGQPLKIVRHLFAPGHGFGRHDHEFAEVFWCESGGGFHDLGDHLIPVVPGDLVFIRPETIHAGRAGARGWTFVNVSFPPHLMTELEARYSGAPATDSADTQARAGDAINANPKGHPVRNPAGRPGPDWPWRRGEPLHLHLSPRRMERLHEWAADLAAPGQREHDLACFLLDLVRIAARADGPDAANGLPGWLREALEVFADPRHLRGGTAALARLTGRSADRINRVVRAAQDRTATDLVNALRLDAAATALRMGDRPVADLAADCGLANLGHFYRLFRARYRVTPARYRRAAHQEVLGGRPDGGAGAAAVERASPARARRPWRTDPP
jgi:AraC family cel operon transcriptional repressor